MHVYVKMLKLCRDLGSLYVVAPVTKDEKVCLASYLIDNYLILSTYLYYTHYSHIFTV